MGGVPVDGFDPGVSTYVVDRPANGWVPAVGAVAAAPGARVRITSGGDVVPSSASGSTTRTIEVTSANGSVTGTRTVGFHRTDRVQRPSWNAGGYRDRDPGSAGRTGPWSPAGEWEVSGGHAVRRPGATAPPPV